MRRFSREEYSNGEGSLCGRLDCGVFASQGRAAELVLPQGKGAFYAGEAIELAVAGLDQDATATLELVPQGDGGLGAVSLLVQGDGSTVTFVLPPMTLAPGKYAVRLDGRPSPVELVVSSGVNISTMLLSQSANLEDVKPSGGNFILGNAFVFGLIGPDGMPSRDPRGRAPACRRLTGRSRSTSRRWSTCTGPATSPTSPGAIAKAGPSVAWVTL